MDYYNTRTLIYENNKIVGYTNTVKEADDLCIKNPKYSWDFPPKNKKINYDKYKQFTVYNE